MNENDRLAQELYVELSKLCLRWLLHVDSSEVFLNRLKFVFKASNL